MRDCPKCGNTMKKAADWPDDWLVCLDCLHSEKKSEKVGQNELVQQ